MNKLTSSKNSSIILLLTLIVSILFALYYYLLLPRLNEVEAKRVMYHRYSKRFLV